MPSTSPLLQKAPLAIPNAMVLTVRAAYESPPRSYHSFEHIEEVLGHWLKFDAQRLWQHRAETWLAILYHDAVYEPGRRDNEALSAALARHEIESHLPVGSVDIDRVCSLIEMTARHGRLRPQDLDADARLFLDCDMAVLGAKPERFQAYDRAIGEEYRDSLPAWLFRFNRRRFLKRLLESPRIYLSEPGAALWEKPARENIKWAIQQGRTALAAGAGR